MKQDPNDPNTIYLDGSGIKTFMECPTQWNYYARHGREAVAESPGRNFGSAMHLYWDWHYRRLAENGMVMPTEATTAAHDIMVPYFNENPQPIDEYRGASYGIKFATAYASEYSLENFTVLKQGNESMVELPFAVHLADFRCQQQVYQVIYCGKIDLVAQWPDGVFTMDHKTSKQGGQSFFDEYVNDISQLGYLWALRETAQIEACGMCINGAITHKNITRDSFTRQRILVDSSRLDEWYENTVAIVRAIFDCIEREYFPMFSTRCKGRFGRCQYLDTCCMDPKSRLTHLQSGLYRDVEWSPLHGD